MELQLFNWSGYGEDIGRFHVLITYPCFCARRGQKKNIALAANPNHMAYDTISMYALLYPHIFDFDKIECIRQRDMVRRLGSGQVPVYYK